MLSKQKHDFHFIQLEEFNTESDCLFNNQTLHIELNSIILPAGQYKHKSSLSRLLDNNFGNPPEPFDYSDIQETGIRKIRMSLIMGVC